MTPRERTLACLNGDPVDRIPAVHFGFWRETLRDWAKRGHISPALAEAYEDGNKADQELSRLLGFDHAWAPLTGPNTYLMPRFEKKVIHTLPDGSRHVLNEDGVTELEVPGAVSIRSEIEHLLTDAESWNTHYKHRLQWSPQRVPDTGSLDPEFSSRPRGLWCGSLIGKIRNMLGVEGFSYLTVDDPELLDELIDTVGSLCLRGVTETLEGGFPFDVGLFWEDICFNHGPLVNPSFFRDKVVPWYRKITTVLADHGVRLVSVDCDGCIDALVPHWLDAGVNVMFPIEVGTWDGNFAGWKREFGTRVKGVGGMRKELFAADRNAIDREIERLRPIFDLGGYVPCPDHRIPPGSRWELVQYYTDALKALNP